MKKCPQVVKWLLQTLFDSMDDMETSRRSDERVVEVLVGFLDELLGFPLLHASIEEERFEGWKHGVVIHPRQLSDAQRDRIYNT